ncbi:hypothetical protein T484DRAFT_1790795, partial [Baffinella frigidus]
MNAVNFAGDLEVTQWNAPEPTNEDLPKGASFGPPSTSGAAAESPAAPAARAPKIGSKRSDAAFIRKNSSSGSSGEASGGGDTDVVWKSMSSECTEERRRFLEDKDKAKLVRERMMNYTNPGAARRSSLPVNDAAAAAPKGLSPLTFRGAARRSSLPVNDAAAAAPKGKKGRRGSLLGPCLTKQGKRGRRGSLLGPCLTKQLIEYDALVEYVTQTIIERIGETVPAPR